MNANLKDLVVLVADKNMEYVIRGLLERYHSFGIRKLNFDIFIHPERDPGIFNRAGELLRNFYRDYHFCMVFLDREGSGQERLTSTEISEKIEIDLKRTGWNNRAKVIVFDPEVEVWLWVNSTNFLRNIGWRSMRNVREHLIRNGYTFMDNKPERPKEALQELLRISKIPRSSAIYYQIAHNVSFRNCTDTSFAIFRQTLQNWFKRQGSEVQHT